MPNKLPTIMSQDLSYNEGAKNAFAKEAKSQLRRLAKAMGLEKSEYRISFNKGGIAVSGEAALHADHIYVQIEQGMLGQPVLFRTCDSQKDCRGHQNNFADATVFNDDQINGFADKLKAMMQRIAA